MKTQIKPAFADFIAYPAKAVLAKFPGSSKQRENRSNKKKTAITLKEACSLADEMPLLAK